MLPQLDPQMAEILRLIASVDLPPYESMSGAEARAAAEERNLFWNEGNPDVASVRDVAIPGPAGDMAVRLYEPAGAAAVSPGILYIHGGGWVICSLDTHDGVCRRLANAAGVRVASLDYRMAPEHPFPAPLDDCVAATRWLLAQGTRAGHRSSRAGARGRFGRRQSRPGDAGRPTRPRRASAPDCGADLRCILGGSGFALAPALRRRRVRPVHPHDAVVLGPVCSGPGEAHRSARGAVACRLAGLPPLYVSAAELDPLRDDSERLAAKLALAGVDFDYRLWRGVCHACFMMSRILSAADEEIAEVAAFLRRRLTS